MKNLALVFFVFFVAFGCESGPKVLNWNKTASEQNLQIGDTLTVEGIAYNLFPYAYQHRLIVRDTVRTYAN